MSMQPVLPRDMPRDLN